MPEEPERSDAKPSHTIVIDALLSRVEKYGIATVLLLLLLFWAKPHADKMIESHGKLLESAVEVQAKQAVTLEATKDVQVKQSETLDAATRTLERVDRNAADTNTTVREIRAKVGGQ